MPALRAFRLAALVLIALALAPGAAEAQQTPLQLDRAQSLHLGRALLAEGRPAPARAIAEALLGGDARDAEAGVLLAAALNQQGRHAQARHTALRAHLRGQTDAARFEAAMLAGRAEFHRGAHGRAQFWLRRAAHVAPDQATRALAERNFHQVRRLNPLQLRFNLGLARSSNINDGTSAEEITFLGLPFRVQGASRALSGTELSTDLALRYRIAQAEGRETALTLHAATRSYRLSRSAREQAPEARARDFAFQQLEIGALHRIMAQDSRRFYELAGAVGRQWYGGAPLGDHLRLSLSQTTGLSEATQMRLTLSGQRQRRLDSAARSSTRLGIGGALHHRLAGGDHVALRLGVQRTRARSPHVQNTALQAQVSYTLAEPVMGMRLSAFADLAERRFPVAGVQPEGRRDLQGRVGLTAMVERIDYMGFSPTVQVQYARTRSTMAIHQRRSFDVFLGIGSRF